MSKFPEIHAKFNSFEQLSEFSWNSGKIPWKFQRKTSNLLGFQRNFEKFMKESEFLRNLCENLQILSLERGKRMLIL
jgi:hypothetical protein